MSGLFTWVSTRSNQARLPINACAGPLPMRSTWMRLLKEVLGGHGILLGSLLTKDHFGYDPAVKPYPYDPEKAKKLLAESGYAKGFDFVLNSPADRYLKDKEVAEAVVGYLRKAGINASVKFHEWGNYLKQIILGHKANPSYLLGWGDTTYDADFTL